MSASYLAGIHAVREALRAGRSIETLIVAREAKNPRLQPILSECRRLKIPIRRETGSMLDRLAGGLPHQGVLAGVTQVTSASLGNIIDGLDHPGLFVILDGVEDPHNLGAIIRSAYAAGADAIVIPDRRSAKLTETVSKVAAGALEYLPVVRVTNTKHAITRLKAADFWIYGFDERAEQVYTDADYDGNVALIFGGEGEGLRRLAVKHCDFLVKIPAAGRIASLNVSVAAGVALFEVLRQRRTRRK